MTAFLLEILLQILAEALAEFLLGFGFESVAQIFRPNRKSNVYMAAFGAVLLGGIIGALSAYFYPHQVASPFRFPWISLILSPLACGFALKQVGEWRKRRGGESTFLSTFLGGFVFAFSIAVARFILIKFVFAKL
ncbi:MAG: hypothetical protein LWW79_12360 [Holophagaceae bacterium]|nr:hypothetical protein [Holophagaceae bacterium]